MRPRMSILFVPVFLILAGFQTRCVSVGADFPSEVKWITINQTNRSELETRLGEPFQVGYDSGQQTWTWGFYRYSLFRPMRTKDLVVRFNPNGTVSSYSFSSSFEDDIQTLKNK